MTPLVIVGCGKNKLDRPAPAFELYTGDSFRSVLEYARTLTPDHRILLLSGRYGLVRGSRVLEPYDQPMRRPSDQLSAVPAVRAQAVALGVAGEINVVALVGQKRYGRLVRGVWPNVRFPIPSIPGVMTRREWVKAQLGEVSV